MFQILCLSIEGKQLFFALASNPLCSNGAEEKCPSVQQHEDLEEESDARHDLKASASRR